jgi:hypothetical protein
VRSHQRGAHHSNEGEAACASSGGEGDSVMVDAVILALHPEFKPDGDPETNTLFAADRNVSFWTPNYAKRLK